MRLGSGDNFLFYVSTTLKEETRILHIKVTLPRLFSRNLLYLLVNVTDFSFISLTQVFVPCLSITSARHCKFLHTVPI